MKNVSVSHVLSEFLYRVWVHGGVAHDSDSEKDEPRLTEDFHRFGTWAAAWMWKSQCNGPFGCRIGADNDTSSLLYFQQIYWHLKLWQIPVFISSFAELFKPFWVGLGYFLGLRWICATLVNSFVILIFWDICVSEN